MKQMTLSTGGFDRYGKTTRRAAFLAEMSRVVPWSVLCALIEPVYPKAGSGRPPVGLERMLRIYFLQNWFNLSDPAVEEALYDSLSMREFVGIDLGREGAPDETTVCKFRHMLEAHELGKRLRDDAIVTCDSGTVATWWARHIPARRGQIHTLSGNLATMAPGLPYAIGAQVAYPDRQVVAFVGDGGFSMLMADFVTAVKYNLPIKVVIIKNNYLGQIKWEQMVMLGNPEFAVDLAPIDFAMYAQACGGTGLTSREPKTCGDAIDRFLNTPGPAILQAEVDPNTAPLPGKIKPEQAFRFAESLARGEKDAVKIIENALKDRARELV